MRHAPAEPASTRPAELVRWRVRFVVELNGREWQCEDRVWARNSADASLRAEANFYADVEPEARRLISLRVTGVLQEAV